MRLAALARAAALTRIGSEGEIQEPQDRADDALHAMRAALADGVVPGGGIALFRAADALAGYETSMPEE